MHATSPNLLQVGIEYRLGLAKCRRSRQGDSKPQASRVARSKSASGSRPAGYDHLENSSWCAFQWATSSFCTLSISSETTGRSRNSKVFNVSQNCLNLRWLSNLVLVVFLSCTWNVSPSSSDDVASIVLFFIGIFFLDLVLVLFRNCSSTSSDIIFTVPFFTGIFLLGSGSGALSQLSFHFQWSYFRCSFLHWHFLSRILFWCSFSIFLPLLVILFPLFSYSFELSFFDEFLVSFHNYISSYGDAIFTVLFFIGIFLLGSGFRARSQLFFHLQSTVLFFTGIVLFDQFLVFFLNYTSTSSELISIVRFSLKSFFLDLVFVVFLNCSSTSTVLFVTAIFPF